MAIIYTYPVKTTPNANDLILISDSEDSNKTKQVKISSLPSGGSSGVTQIIAGTNVTIDPVGGTGNVTINASGGSSGVTAVTATSPLVSSGGNTPAISLSGITGFGTAYQVLKVNGTADGLYWDTAGVTSNIYTANGTVSGSGNERSLNFSNTKSLVLNNPNSFIIDASNTAHDYNTAMVHVMKQGVSKFAVMQDGRTIVNNGGNVTIPSQETSAILHAKSTDKGFLMPTMTGEQIETISSPATGLKAYATSAGSGDVTSAGTWTYNGSNWVTPGGATSLNGLSDVSYAATQDASMYIGNGAPSGLVGTPTKTTALGEGSGVGTTSGSSNTLIGTNAGIGVTTGSTNTFLGSDSGDTITTGAGNIILGAGADSNANNVNASIAIGKNTVTSTSSVAIGDSASATGGGIALGRGATNTVANLALGSATYPLLNTTDSGDVSGLATGQNPAKFIEVQIGATKYYMALYEQA